MALLCFAVSAVPDKRSSVTKSDDSFLSSNESSVESDKITLHSNGSDILAPHRPKSVDFSRNGSANRDAPPPTATATIIRSPSASATPMVARKTGVDMMLPHQVDNISSHSRAMLTSDSQFQLQARQRACSQRRSSEGDVGVRIRAKDRVWQLTVAKQKYPAR